MQSWPAKKWALGILKNPYCVLLCWSKPRTTFKEVYVVQLLHTTVLCKNRPRAQNEIHTKTKTMTMTKEKAVPDIEISLPLCWPGAHQTSHSRAFAAAVAVMDHRQVPIKRHVNLNFSTIFGVQV